MQKAVFSEAVRVLAAKIVINHEFRAWVAKSLPSMGGGQRQMLVEAISASGIKDDRFDRALRCPKTEDIIREPKRLSLIQ